MPIDEVSQRFRDDHHATLLAVNRLGTTYINPAQDFALFVDDEALIVAEKLGALKPVHHFTGTDRRDTRRADATTPRRKPRPD